MNDMQQDSKNLTKGQYLEDVEFQDDWMTSSETITNNGVDVLSKYNNERIPVMIAQVPTALGIAVGTSYPPVNFLKNFDNSSRTKITGNLDSATGNYSSTDDTITNNYIAPKTYWDAMWALRQKTWKFTTPDFLGNPFIIVVWAWKVEKEEK